MIVESSICGWTTERYSGKRSFVASFVASIVASFVASIVASLVTDASPPLMRHHALLDVVRFNLVPSFASSGASPVEISCISSEVSTSGAKSHRKFSPRESRRAGIPENLLIEVDLSVGLVEVLLVSGEGWPSELGSRRSSTNSDSSCPVGAFCLLKWSHFGLFMTGFRLSRDCAERRHPDIRRLNPLRLLTLDMLNVDKE